MARFYMHLVKSDIVTKDETGVDIPEPDAEVAARKIAIEAARGIMSAQVIEGRLDLGLRIEIENDTGVVVDTVQFRDTVIFGHAI